MDNLESGSVPLTAVEANPGQLGRTWAEVVEAFASADWNLRSAKGTGDLHPYPARFIPAIPALALEILQPSGTVLDPFCGSGTTLLQARARGLNAIGNDLNPIACLIARVQTTEWAPGDDDAGKRHSRGLAEATLAPSMEALCTDIPRLDHWFDPWAQRAMQAATAYLDRISSDDPWHDRVALAISAATVRLSRQESDTRYAAIDKPGDLRSAAATFERAATRVTEWLRVNAIPGASSLVLEGDAREMAEIPDSSVSAAIFSPPYPNAYEYWLYHKYRMYWLGHDPIAVRESEMGARPHYSKKNGLTEDDFAKQMRLVFCELRRVLKPGSPVVVVIGDSTIGGRHIDNGELLTDAVLREGFDCHGSRERIILRTRSSFNSSHTRGRKNEHVILYRSPR